MQYRIMIVRELHSQISSQMCEDARRYYHVLRVFMQNDEKYASNIGAKASPFNVRRCLNIQKYIIKQINNQVFL